MIQQPSHKRKSYPTRRYPCFRTFRTALFLARPVKVGLALSWGVASTFGTLFTLLNMTNLGRMQ